MNSAALPAHDASPQLVIDMAARDDWVEVQLMHNFMRHAKSALHLASLVLPVIVAILYHDVNQAALLGWALAVVLITLMRYRVVSLYYRDYAHASTASGGAQLRAFLSRYGWTWTVSAVIWGGSMFLYFRKAPVYDQFICLIVLVGMAGYATGAFSASWRCFNGYVNGLAGSTLAVVAYSVVIERPFIGTGTTYGLVVLVLIYWAAVRTAGRHFHRAQRRNLELQFANTALIASLTEQTRTALEAVEIKNRFIASAAHDLRQPVHALSLYADWLRAEPEMVTQLTPKILQATQAVNALFNSLFDLAKLDASVIEVNWQRVDLAALVEEMVLQYAPLAQGKGLVLRQRVVPAELLSDPELLKRLIGNLLSNAIRHTERGGILLALRQGPTGPAIEVWDTGVGIAPEHQQAIFQEFYRVALHNGTEESFGLGLSVVSRLCAALNCRLSVRSRPGRGTVFRLDVPPLEDGI